MALSFFLGVLWLSVCIPVLGIDARVGSSVRFCPPGSNHCFALDEMVVESEFPVRRLNDTNHASQEQEQEHDTEHDSGNHVHKHHTIIFCVIAIFMGCLVQSLMLFETFRSLQFTVAMFLIGMLWTLLWEPGFLPGGLQSSYGMWTGIDPHMILWLFLPPLLLADSMTIDASHFYNLSFQILWLAGPCVLLNVAAVSPMLKMILGTSWPVCAAAAAAWSATDPVAVVGLLKALGASPTLTLLIQGEALLNDGSAVIMFNIANSLIKGDIQYQFGTVWVDIWVQAIGAIAIGTAAALSTILMTYAIQKTFNHNGGIIQVLLVFIISYATWAVAEDQFGSSGVLAVVSCGICLAQSMWYGVVDKHEMHLIWHFMEWLLNTVVFFLAGVLTAHVVYTTISKDLVILRHIVVVYFALMFVRFFVILVSKPILDKLSRDGNTVTFPDICVMSWGGLRGAVSLSLGLVLRQHGETGKISRKDADRIFAITAGVVFLTLVVNSPLCPLLVRKFRLTALTDIQEWIVSETAEFLKETVTAKFGLNQKAFQEIIQREQTSQFRVPSIVPMKSENWDADQSFAKPIIIEVLQAARDAWPKYKNKYSHLPEPPDDILQRTTAIADSDERSCTVSRHMNMMFLQLVQSEYWRLIDSGNFASATGRTYNLQVSHLMLSVQRGLASSDCGLGDLAVLFDLFRIREIRPDGVNINSWPQFSLGEYVREQTRAARTNLYEYIVVYPVMLGFFVWTCIEVKVENDVDFKASPFWLVVMSLFGLVFISELLVRHCVSKQPVTAKLDDIFNVLFIFIFFAELFIEFFAFFSGGFDGKRRNLRDLTRFLSLFRLHIPVFSVWDWVASFSGCNEGQVADPLRLQGDLDVISVLEAYVQGHQYAQKTFEQFFSRKTNRMVPEVAKCLLESYCTVYKAMTILEIEAAKLEKIEGCSYVLERRFGLDKTLKIVAELETEIYAQRRTGVLDTKQAFTLLNPLRKTARGAQKEKRRLVRGILSEHLFAYQLRRGTATSDIVRIISCDVKDRQSSRNSWPDLSSFRGGVREVRTQSSSSLT